MYNFFKIDYFLINTLGVHGVYILIQLLYGVIQQLHVEEQVSLVPT